VLGVFFLCRTTYLTMLNPSSSVALQQELFREKLSPIGYARCDSGTAKPKPFGRKGQRYAPQQTAGCNCLKYI
jgi:hypothetical protein